MMPSFRRVFSPFSVRVTRLLRPRTTVGSVTPRMQIPSKVMNASESSSTRRIISTSWAGSPVSVNRPDPIRTQLICCSLS